MRRVLMGVLVLLLSSPTWAADLRLPPGKWWENERLVERVELSSEQQSRIHDLVYAHALRMIDLKGAVERRELELTDQVDREAFDPAKVRAAFTALQNARQDLELEHFELLLAIRQVLSADQWQRLQQLHEEVKKERLGDRPGAERPGMGGRRPGPDRPRPPGR